jgi:hypothetical protein
MEVALVFLGASVGAFLGSVLLSLLARRKDFPEPAQAQPTRPKERAAIFSKPSGKRSPKVNDDFAAYRKEFEN